MVFFAGVLLRVRLVPEGGDEAFSGAGEAGAFLAAGDLARLGEAAGLAAALALGAAEGGGWRARWGKGGVSTQTSKEP